MSAPRSLRYGLLGLLQGGLIWALLKDDLIPVAALSGELRGALLALVGLGLPLVYQSADSAWTPRRRALVLAGLGLWLSLEAYWLASSSLPSGSLLPRIDAPGTLGLLLWPPVALALALGWDPLRRRFDYGRLFEFAWRNALLVVVSALLLCLFWSTLWAGAWLLDSIGIRAVRELIARSGFAWPASAAVCALAWAQGLARTSAIAGLRRFWLGLNAWFYPLALGFGVAWSVALPFTGMKTLFDTRNAAFLLLWFAAVSVKFCNAAWQDGKEPPHYPRWLGAVLPWAQLSLLVVMAVAVLALQARIAQHGLSAERIWAVYVALVLALYALGYALSVLPAWRRLGWMANVGATNTAVAMLALLGAGLLLSPVLDARRLAVRQQLARLQARIVTPGDFDFNALAYRHGRVGRDAVEALARRKGGEQDSRIAALARAALAAPAYRDRDREPTPPSADAVAQLRLWPRDMPLDPAFEARLTSATADWRDAECLRRAPRCLLWRIDLDGDGQVEILMLTAGSEGGLGVYQHLDGHWRYAGLYRVLPAGNFDVLAARIEAGAIKTQAPRLPELVIDGNTAVFNPD